MLFALNTSNELDLSMFKKVSLKDRFLARIYDTVRFWIFYGVITFLFSYVAILLSPFWLYFLKLKSFGPLIATIVSLGWFLFRDGLRGAQSWGKEKQDILVICTDTFQDCTIFRSFIRNIISEISAAIIVLQFSNIASFSIVYMVILAIDIFRIILSPGGRRIGDLISKTQVIYLDDWAKYRESFKQQ